MGGRRTRGLERWVRGSGTREREGCWLLAVGCRMISIFICLLLVVIVGCWGGWIGQGWRSGLLVSRANPPGFFPAA
jgi:hypothetical protein